MEMVWYWWVAIVFAVYLTIGFVLAFTMNWKDLILWGPKFFAVWVITSNKEGR